MSQPEVLDQNSPMVVTFMTTEHFVLQTARSAGITETVGRAATESNLARRAAVRVDTNASRWLNTLQ